jgi:hypothetical protein
MSEVLNSKFLQRVQQSEEEQEGFNPHRQPKFLDRIREIEQQQQQHQQQQHEIGYLPENEFEVYRPEPGRSLEDQVFEFLKRKSKVFAKDLSVDARGEGEKGEKGGTSCTPSKDF